MSTEYKITDRLFLLEASSKVNFIIDNLPLEIASTKEITAVQLRLAIIKQIEVLSYISEDANEVLKRFNVSYGDFK